MTCSWDKEKEKEIYKHLHVSQNSTDSFEGAITPDSLLDFKAPEKKEICEIILKFAKPTQILKIEIVSSCRMCEIYTKYEGKSFSYSGTMRCYLIDDSEKIDESLKYNILSGSLSTQNKTQFVEQLKIKCVSMKNPQLFQFHHLSLQTGSQNSNLSASTEAPASSFAGMNSMMTSMMTGSIPGGMNGSNPQMFSHPMLMKMLMGSARNQANLSNSTNASSSTPNKPSPAVHQTDPNAPPASSTESRNSKKNKKQKKQQNQIVSPSSSDSSDHSNDLQTMIKSYMDQMEERMINQMERTMSTDRKSVV